MRDRASRLLHRLKPNFRHPGQGRWLARTVQFGKDYTLPLIVSAVFVSLVVSAVLLRMSQQSSLADLLVEVSDVDNNYATLLSKDEVEEPKKRSVDDEVDTVNTAGGFSPFAISSGGSTSSSSAFTASIDHFRRTSTDLECHTPKPRPQTCSKRYTFGAGLRSVNGPGSINYGWRSDVAGVSENGSVSVGGGNTLTLLQKTVTLECKTPSSFSLRLVVNSPNSAQSTNIRINHNCNEL